MGLDLVELTMSVEERFDVRFEDRDFENVGTVGALHRLILRKRGLVDRGHDDAACRSLQRFLTLRRDLVARYGHERRTIRPRTPLRDVLPSRLAQQAWLVEGASLGLSLPHYGLNEDWLFAAWMTTLGFVPLAGVLLGGWWWVPVLLGFVGGWAMLLRLLTRSAPSTYTVGAATMELLANESSAGEDGESNEAHRLWQSLRSLVAEQLAVPREDVTYRARFIEDLGAD